jgi:hypothetical protein
MGLIAGSARSLAASTASSLADGHRDSNNVVGPALLWLLLLLLLLLLLCGCARTLSTRANDTLPPRRSAIT